MNTGQYFTNEQLPSSMKDFMAVILGHKFVFTTDNGVFSKNGLDFGTRVLLENIPLSDLSGEILDVGCGYGPIGIVVAKVTSLLVTMCDVNHRALHLAKKNASNNNVHVQILESDCYNSLDPNKKFDVIITNPPIRAGKKVVYEIVMGARHHLKETGKLFLVVRKEQGAKSMINDLAEYYQVTVLDKIKGFFIIECTF
ncbi:MAG: methyltransferase [Bacilli bacterium]